MKRRFALTGLASLIVTLSGFIWYSYQQTSAQQETTQVKVQLERPHKSPRIKSVIKGSERPEQIPDAAAYELFLRTVAEGNAKTLVERIGLKGEQAKAVINEAYSLNESLLVLDREAYELKSKRQVRNEVQRMSDLTRLQVRKDELVDQAMNRYLVPKLKSAATVKLKGYIQEVKKNIQKVIVDDYPNTAGIAIGRSNFQLFTPRRIQSGGALYLYSTGWHDDLNVYGSGSISEQYTSDSSYRIIVTVTSPSGRSNTSAGDWNYATVVYNSGLSIGDEDGTYSITADFEEQSGYYDEYGNFYGGGAYWVGSSSSTDLVDPILSLRQVRLLPVNPTGPNSVTDVSVQVFTTPNIPAGTIVVIDISELSSGNIPYSIEDVEETGNTDSLPRTVRRRINNPGTILESVMFRIRVGTTNNAGTISNLIRIDRAFVILPGGTTQAVAVGGAPITANLIIQQTTASSCNPSGLLVAWCINGGGEWMYPPPSSQCGCSTGIEKSPILLDILGNGFAMTDAANGVLFDFDGIGIPVNLSWTAFSSDDAWLVLDRNQNNRIDNGAELFGNRTPQPDPPAGEKRQGFLALAEYDKVQNGGNGDGKITRSDAVFRKLRLWNDRNHNGVSEAEELFKLPALDVVAIQLDYRESNRVDEFGNRFRYRAKVRDSANAKVGRWAWDVYLNAGP